MIGLGIKIVQRPPAVEKIIKNLNYGTAVGLTKTAKQGQAAVVDALQGAFTLRGNWWQPSNRFGIRITPATKDRLQSSVQTAADWLRIHEEGGDKHPRGRSLAVPTDQVRRNKRAIIPRNQRPKGLAGKAFVLQTKRGPVLAQRLTRGKRKGLIVLYGLEPTVKIKQRPVFRQPIQHIVERNLKSNIAEGIAMALRTMR